MLDKLPKSLQGQAKGLIHQMYLAPTQEEGLDVFKTIYIDPGSPWQNGYIESFHSRFRDECLDREIRLSLREARVVIEDWRQHYNRERPHSRLGYVSPEAFIEAERNSILSREVDQF